MVADPERDRQPADYDAAVADWHEARADAWEQALLENDGDAGFLVWGDPAFYDSTIRIVERVLERGEVQAEFDVVPGISSLQLLAARHRIVLHEVGQPVHVTTGRRLREAVDAGQDNIVVMLNRSLDPWSRSTTGRSGGEPTSAHPASTWSPAGSRTSCRTSRPPEPRSRNRPAG